MSDERFVEFLRKAGAEYHAPPETPREAMWEAIEAVWAGDLTADLSEATASYVADSAEVSVATEADGLTAVAAASYHAPPQLPREAMWERVESAWRLRTAAEAARARRAGGPSPRRRAVPWITGIAIAASLVIGVAIGRRSMEQIGSEPASSSITRADQLRIDAPEAGAPEAGTPEAGTPEVGATRPETRLAAAELETRPAAAGPGQPGEISADPVDARGGEPRGGVSGTSDRDRNPGLRGNAGVRVATLDHLSRTELFLTSFRAEAETADGEEVSRWARRLLTDTRLLLDRQEGGDRRMTVLLEELELVLAQIVQLGGDGRAGEREIIMDGMQAQGTLPRLRSAIPTGPVTIQTQGA